MVVVAGDVALAQVRFRVDALLVRCEARSVAMTELGQTGKPTDRDELVRLTAISGHDLALAQNSKR